MSFDILKSLSVYCRTLGLISGVTVSASLFLGTVMRAICSRRFSDDDLLFFTVQKSMMTRLFYQVVANLLIQYYMKVFILGNTIMFTDIVKDGVLVFMNTLFSKAMFYLMNLLYSCLWDITKNYSFLDLGEWYHNEFDYSWRLLVKDDVCLYEMFERAGICIGIVLAILVIYSGNIYNKFTYYYKL